MRLIHCSPEQAGTLQNLWQPWVEAIAKRCELPSAPFFLDILQGSDTVHLIWDDDCGGCRGVVITTFAIDDDGRRHCHLPYCTGEGMDRWFHLLGELEHWARQHDAVSLKTIARLGWTRLMKNEGYAMTHAYMQKGL